MGANVPDRFATVAVVDTNGLLRGQKVCGDDLSGILEDGMGMSPAQLALDPTDVFLHLPGITDDTSDYHDSRLKVDQSSRVTVPFEAPQDSALYLAEFTGDAQALCPRSVLRRMVDRAAEAGYAATLGIELEYTLFDETARTLAEKDFDQLLTATRHASHDLVIYQAAQSEFYGAVADMCDTLGVRLAKMHEEIGGGFMEACIRAAPALSAADQAVLFRNFVRVLAMRRGQTVSFMPRWSEEADSQSSHIHVSLRDRAGEPVFWDPSEPHNMSVTFRHFIGGLQQFLPEVMLVFAPTVNSWRRFAEGTFAPPAFTWGIENRTTCLRVVGESAGSLRVENRLPCSDANPHLAAAATIAAGLAGIAGRIEPEDPVVGNGFTSGGGKPLAKSMEAAIAAMRESEFATQWLGPRFVETFTASRLSQVEQFRGKTLIDERRRFFELG
ncbi:glutamine synthetase family protein [Novosphingobium cyanobacteriorum]|uniref:Glutamine synthetase family protein n=1 Tax=Novosphingobium cyanobacteriorum TaxID=3024215 RepID=A0ABT6CJQ7_9SPHN|nr:glutamine synthetase family protein [Novosphingobium cyanobacteriorum]MDF8333769.1 glutamine synthetase family protein [Novosphingobium cyanobacteriorum]